MLGPIVFFVSVAPAPYLEEESIISDEIGMAWLLCSFLLSFYIPFRLSKKRIKKEKTESKNEKKSHPPKQADTKKPNTTSHNSSANIAYIIGGLIFGAIGVAIIITDPGIWLMGVILALVMPVGWIHARVTACSACGKYYSVEEMKKEFKSSQTQYEQKTQVTKHYGRDREVIGTSEKQVTAPVDYNKYELTFICKNCGHAEKRTKTERA